MADIIKCSTENCPLEATCWRKQVIADPYRQAYGNFPVTKGKCEFYMPLKTASYMTIDVTPL